MISLHIIMPCFALHCGLLVFSDDSWLGEDDGGAADSTEPIKRVNQHLRPTASASTVDSYDAAFQRKNQQSLPDTSSQRDDEFFG